MGRRVVNRYPIDPIVDMVRLRLGKGPDDRVPVLEFCRLTGMDRNAYYRASKHGGATTYAADRLAISMGRHPAEVWPTWFEDAKHEPRCIRCRHLIPTRDGRSECKRYCSEDCELLAKRKRQAAALRAKRAAQRAARRVAA